MSFMSSWDLAMNHPYHAKVICFILMKTLAKIFVPTSKVCGKAWFQKGTGQCMLARYSTEVHTPVRLYHFSLLIYNIWCSSFRRIRLPGRRPVPIPPGGLRPSYPTESTPPEDRDVERLPNPRIDSASRSRVPRERIASRRDDPAPTAHRRARPQGRHPRRHPRRAGDHATVLRRESARP
jgi:hypothetical protein